jgi:hypothetical protein
MPTTVSPVATPASPDSTLSTAPPTDPARVTSAMAGPPRPRQCGRCRRFFVGEATSGEPSSEVSDVMVWWACPPCRAKLFTGSGAGPLQKSGSERA